MSRVWVAMLAIGLQACSGSSTDHPASGRSALQSASAGRADRWSVTPLLTLGAAEGDSLVTFGRIADVDVDVWGRVYVLDSYAKAVRIFERNGTYVRSLGRSGSGPGEFQMATAIHVDRKGRLWVLDARNARFTVFDTAGPYLGDVLRTGMGPTQALPWAGGFDSAGRVHEWRFSRSARQAGTIEVVTYEAPLNGHLQELAVTRIPNRRGPGLPAPALGPSASLIMPYGPHNVWRIDPGGDVWYGFTKTYEIRHVDATGATSQVYSREVAPVAVTSEEKRREIDRITHQLPRVNITPSQLPDVKPPFSEFLVTDDGYLVVGRTLVEDAKTVGDSYAFDVFAPWGAFLGEVSSPVPIGVRTWPSKIRGEYMVGVVKDQDDVESVRLAHVDRHTQQ